MRGSHTSWEVHVQNGLVLSAQNNEEKVIAEFYFTQSSPSIPDSILHKDHVVPWWEDEKTLELCRALIRRDPPLAPGFQRPARLLHLGLGSSGLESDLRLIEDTTCVKKYATLSHCWLQSPSDSPTRTLRGNIEAHKRCIRFGCLSRTFQQAVIACRRLKIQYLWIDSLCIIQDDINKADWEREGAIMDDIYAGSSATLAMHSVPGFRPTIPYHSLTYHRGNEKATIHVRRVPYHQDLSHNVAAAPQATLKNEIAPNEAWARVSLRGWCYQERALSRRVFHLTPAEILVEQDGRIIYCQCTHHCSSERAGFAGWLTSRSQGGEIIMRADLAKYAWSNAVRQYTQRMFSYQSDLLPGLAGLARRMNRPEHDMETYIAGLWGDSSPGNLTLLRWLCWQSLPWESAYPGDRFCDNCRPRPRRNLPSPTPGNSKPEEPEPAIFIPSFSWASRFGPCEFIHDPWKSYEWIPTAEVVHVVCGAKPGVTYGQVYGGFIDMTEYAYVLDLGFPDRWEIDWSRRNCLDNVRVCGRRYVIDAADDIPDNQEAVYLLELFRNTVDAYETSICLVLTHDNSKGKVIGTRGLAEYRDNPRPQCYRRVGIGKFSLAGFGDGALGSIPNTEIRLV
ncbi:hypothetical protein DL765_002535 [Monosporascus sp. GIB2]|nr:hypothetical protein DL765_002535 [Monosporascus sp. GIB2]